MMKTNQHKLTKPPLQVADFICRHCRVQATRDGDRICGLCKAVGKTAEPEAQASRREGRFAAMLAKPIMHWFIEHHLIVLSEAVIPVQKEE